MTAQKLVRMKEFEPDMESLFLVNDIKADKKCLVLLTIIGKHNNYHFRTPNGKSFDDLTKFLKTRFELKKLVIVECLIFQVSLGSTSQRVNYGFLQS